jgi:hypothetical protein
MLSRCKDIQQGSAYCLLHHDFLLGAVFGREDGGNVPPKQRLSQKIKLSLLNKDYYRFECETVYSDRKLLTFRSNLLLPSPRCKSKPRPQKVVHIRPIAK